MLYIKPIAIALLGLLPSAVMADNLTIPGHYEASETLVMPERGRSMDQVLAEFGEPEQRKGPVGEPPISEWDYGDFRVYFEDRWVLHSVNLQTMILPR